MSIVVSYLPSAIGRLAVTEAAKEALLRKSPLTVITVPEAVDIDLLEQQRKAQHAEIAALLDEAGLAHVVWSLQLPTGADIAEVLLDAAEKDDAELIVIGARNRTRVGKMILGSVSQSVLLRSEVPVLVVKPPR